MSTGTYTASGTTLRASRTVTTSSNSDNAVSLSGSAIVFISPAAQDLQVVHVYSATSDLPSATNNHGMIAHVHGDLGNKVLFNIHFSTLRMVEAG